MGLGAGLLAIVAAHAQRFVDQQHVGCFAEAVIDQELRGAGDGVVDLLQCRPAGIFQRSPGNIL